MLVADKEWKSSIIMYSECRIHFVFADLLQAEKGWASRKYHWVELKLVQTEILMVLVGCNLYN